MSIDDRLSIRKRGDSYALLWLRRCCVVMSTDSDHFTFHERASVVLLLNFNGGRRRIRTYRTVCNFVDTQPTLTSSCQGKVMRLL